MQYKATILLAEDDPSLGFIIKDNLEVAGYQTVLCHDGAEAMQVYESSAFDLAILDVMLPKKDGFSIAREIRKTNEQIPILFLTARIAKDDRMEGFRTGADDYITKPFSIEELMMRIAVFRKRSKPASAATGKNIFHFGGYEFIYANMQLGCGGDYIYLTRKESEILKLFCESGGNILKREDILMQVWGDDDYFMGRSLDVFISKLRKRFPQGSGIEFINLHGVGFRMLVHQE